MGSAQKYGYEEGHVRCGVVQFESDVTAESLFAAFSEIPERSEDEVEDEDEGEAARPFEFGKRGREAEVDSGRGAKRTKLEGTWAPQLKAGQRRVYRHSNVGLSAAENKKLKKKQKQEGHWKEFGHIPPMAARRKYVRRENAMTTNLELVNIPTKAGGYTSKVEPLEERERAYTLQEVLDLGLKLVPFKGYDRPVQDKQGKILAVIVPPPEDEGYHGACEEAFTYISDQGEQVKVAESDLHHKRGSGFLALNVGLSYGNGHKFPTVPDLGKYDGLVRSLLDNKSIQRIASFQDACFAMWHPTGYMYYKSNLDKLYDHHDELQRNFPRSIMPTVAFNIGKNVWTFKHIDSQNCPFGWCLITALGHYDYTKGGHIILWELGLVIEFPPGACICIPSALITHSNIPVGERERRLSFTQYCPGEIFRYIENGFCTDAKLTRENPQLLEKNKRMRENRLKRGYEMFSQISSLQSAGFKFATY